MPNSIYFERGKADATKGVKWWCNPYTPGSREAYQWDSGHTLVRRGREAAK